MLFESMLDTVLYARDRFLKPGGLVKPGIANLGTRRHPVEAEGCGPSPCARRAVRVCRGGHASSAR